MRPLGLVLVAALWTSPVCAATEAQIADVAREFACLCGDCPSRPLDECRCGYAGDLRARIGRDLDAGRSKDVITAAFVAEFGRQIFVTPPKEGFNLLAWFMPFFGILLGLFVVRSVLRGWARQGPSTAAAAPSTLSDSDRERLERALSDRP